MEASVGRLSADQTHLRFVSEETGTLDVVFDGRRVWSVDPSSHPPDDSGWRCVPWPDTLASRLHGTAHLALQEHGSQTVIAAATCVFGDGEGRLDLTDQRGRPLSLSKWGRLNQPFELLDSETTEWYLDRAQDLIHLLSAGCGVPAFLAYGSLLGAVRDGKLIGHDMDIDLGYLSSATTPVEAMLESFGIERALVAEGWEVKRQNGGFLQAFVSQPEGGQRNLDIFTMFAEPGGTLYMINDTAIPGTRWDVLPLTEVSLQGRGFQAPANYEDLLEGAYGRGWRVPDPNFVYPGTPHRRKMRRWFGGLREDRDSWGRFYRAHGRDMPVQASHFARSWAPDANVDLVVDVGCGIGSDALFYAGHTAPTVGLDVVRQPLRRGTRRAQRDGVPAEFRPVNLSSPSSTMLVAAQIAQDYPGRRAVAARNLLNALSPWASEEFWRLCSMLLSDGDRCYVQFLTGQDPDSDLDFPDEPRRYLDPDAVSRAAERQGASLVAEQRDIQEAVWQREEQPVACRQVWEWPDERRQR